MTAQPKQRFIFAAFAAIQIRRRPEGRRPCELRYRQDAGPAADLDGGGCREEESLVRLRRHAGRRLTDIAPEI